MPEPLVRIRCGTGSCRKVLLEFYGADRYAAEVDAARSRGDWRRVRQIACRPVEWGGKTQLAPCPRHDERRLSFIETVQRRLKAGLDAKPSVTLRFVHHADLRHAFYLADTQDKTVEEPLRRA